MAPRSGILFALTLALAGCNTAPQQNTQFDDARNPFYQQAEQALDNNDPTRAAAAYEAALAANPKLPTAQYQLGILYAEKLQDPVSSIYHFRRYLELAPESDHAANAKDKIAQETQAFAASLPSTPSQNSDELAKLQADNASLQKQVDEAAHTIAQLQAQLAKHQPDTTATADASAAQAPVTPAGPPPAPQATADTTGAPIPAPADATTPPATVAADGTTPPPPPPAPPRALPLDATNAALTPIAPGTPLPPGVTPPAPAGPTRSYTVVKGDSIWKIAHKMYPGDTKNGVDKIEEANKDAIGGRPLKIGQVLVIPQ